MNLQLRDPMNTIRLRLKPLHSKLGEMVPFPERMSADAAGFDVAAAIDESLTLAPMQRRLIPCGFAMAIPAGYECQVRPRSGLAFKHGVTVLNAPGTIDADYRGEVQVLLINLGDTSFEIQPGLRIAQLIFAPVTQARIEITTNLDATERGDSGFGSTG